MRRASTSSSPTANGEVRRYSIHDPHPEAGWRAFFGKVWYEGGGKPVYQWQSTGGSDDFEPKLSLMPLIFGSLKGTAYALLFSMPIALLAARVFRRLPAAGGEARGQAGDGNHVLAAVRGAGLPRRSLARADP